MSRIGKIARLPEPIQAVVKSRQPCRAVLSVAAPPKEETIAAKAAQTDCEGHRGSSDPRSKNPT
jgi:hypothetical protein